MRINSVTSINNNRTNKNQTQKFGMLTDRGADFVYNIVRHDKLTFDEYSRLGLLASRNREVDVDFFKPSGAAHHYMCLLSSKGDMFKGFLPVKRGDAVEVIAMLRLGVENAEIKANQLRFETFPPDIK